MNKIIFVIGASGSGKTTALKSLEVLDNQDWKIAYFDSIGVPSIAVMEAEYGGLEKWQEAKTFEWVAKIKQDYLSSAHVILDGQIRPSFIEAACYKSCIKSYEAILLDCSDGERERRLVFRGHSSLANQNMMQWAEYLRKEAKNRKFVIIDNTSLSLEETSHELLTTIQDLIIC